MKHIRNDLYANANTRMAKIRRFFETLKRDETNFEDLCRKFELNISERPSHMDGHQLDFPNLVGRGPEGHKVVFDCSKMK